MYHIAVEARLTGPEAGMQAAWQMIADYAINTSEPLSRNEAHICLVNALKKIIMYGSEGVAGTQQPSPLDTSRGQLCAPAMC